MKTKKIEFNYNVDDVSYVGRQLVLRNIERFNKKNSSLYQGLGESFDNKDLDGIKECVENIVKNCHDYAQELISTFQFIEQSPELISSDTEVLENLPNLKKNSFGVDRRSE